jgi:DNA-binding LacI/PurR family transcriptional regulator
VVSGQAKRVRLRDVAAHAGVSVGSASQAFGRPELVSPDVRERVLASAKALGYAGPDPTARRLRLGRAGALGLIFSERLRYLFTDPAAPAFLGGLAAGMEGSTRSLLLPDSRRREASAETVHGATVDGFVKPIGSRERSTRGSGPGRQLPIVTQDQPRDAPTSSARRPRRRTQGCAASAWLTRACWSSRSWRARCVRLALDLSAERLAGYREGLAPHGTSKRCSPAARTPPNRRGRAPAARRDTPPTDPGNERCPRTGSARSRC